jgi:hypothetical protein
VLGAPGDFLNSGNVNGIAAVQLVLLNNEYKTSDGLVGKRVRATGTPFKAITGHHHSKVLLIVKTLSPEPRH